MMRYRLTHRRGLAAIVVLAGLSICAPVAALQAKTPPVPVEEITIVGTPKLHVDSANASQGYKSAWVLFRTSPRLRLVRQVVVKVRGISGRSYTSTGVPNCIRSTLLNATKLIKPGATYRVQFYVRPGAHGKAIRLMLTRTLVAHGTSRLPRCSGG